MHKKDICVDSIREKFSHRLSYGLSLRHFNLSFHVITSFPLVRDIILFIKGPFIIGNWMSF